VIQDDIPAVKDLEAGEARMKLANASAVMKVRQFPIESPSCVPC
jgi:hypothetical protein